MELGRNGRDNAILGEPTSHMPHQILRLHKLIRRKSCLQHLTGLLLIGLTLSPFASRLLGADQENSVQAQEYAEKAMRLVRSGNLTEAEAELRRALEVEPGNGLYLSSLGAVLGMEHRLDESNPYLEKALHVNPGDLAARRNLASNQFQLGLLQPARENLERILRAKPHDQVSILLLGMIAEELKDDRTAVKMLGLVPDLVRERPESIAALARALYHLGNAEQARKTLRGLRFSSAGAQGVLLGGQVAAQAEDFETAERMFMSIWVAYPDRAKLGYNLALAQYHRGRIEESQTTLRKLMVAGHETSDIENLAGWCFYRQGKFKEAVAAMDEAIALDPSAEPNYLDVGMMLIELKQVSGALVAAQKATEVAPESYRAYRLKGLAEIKLGHVVDAVKSFARAVELNPMDRESILGLASAQYDDGAAQAAERTFRQGMERCPRDPILYQEYGAMLLKLAGSNDPSTEPRAVSLLKSALKLDSALSEPHFQLGNLALRKGKIEEAVQHLETAAKLGPKGSKIHYALARAYGRLGKGAEAAREFRIFERLKAEEEAPGSGASASGTKPMGPAFPGEEVKKLGQSGVASPPTRNR